MIDSPFILQVLGFAIVGVMGFGNPVQPVAFQAAFDLLPSFSPLCISWSPAWACWTMRGAAIWSTLWPILFPPGTWPRACVCVLNSSSHSAVVLCVCSLPRGVWCVCSLPGGVWHFYSCLHFYSCYKGPLGVAISTSMISSWFPRTLVMQGFHCTSSIACSW